MINANLHVEDFFPELNAWVEEKLKRSLNEGAAAMKTTAEAQAHGLGDVGEFELVPAARTYGGFRAGVNARNKKFHIFDKGSLGKRTAKLKRDRRKPSWDVNRGGGYTATRSGDLEGKGVTPRNISSRARAAGRAAMFAAIRR